MQDPAKLFQALADETRLQMLYLIRAHRELCVCDLMHVLEITQSKASRHLRYLLNAGLVKDRREAVWIYYRIESRLDPAKLAILDSVSALLEDEQKADLERKLQVWLEEKWNNANRNKPICQDDIMEIPVHG